MTDFPPVILERDYPAPVERVFAAWTDPKRLVHWFRSSDSVWVKTASVDLRPGGAYRIEVSGPESDMYIVYGTYLQVESPRLIEFTWQWEDSTIEPTETAVRVELTPNGDGTHLKLTHYRFSSDHSAQAHDKGWTGVLTTLGAYIAQDATS